MRKSRSKHQLLTLLIFLLQTYDGISQIDSSKVEVRFIDVLDSLYNYPTTCMGFITHWKDESLYNLPRTYSTIENENAKSKRNLSIHGNVLYSFDYRSYIDTPLSLSNLQQHYVQSNLKLVVDNRYPFDVVLRSRRSNHVYFRNYTDVNFFFNGTSYKDLLKQKALKEIDLSYGKEELTIAKNNLTEKANQLAAITEWFSNEQRRSQYLEYKELLARRVRTEAVAGISQDSGLQLPSTSDNLPGAEIGNIPSNLKEFEINDFVKEYESKLLKQNKLREEIGVAEKLYGQNKKKVEAEIKEAKNKINASQSYEELKKVTSKYGIKTDSALRNRFKFLYDLKSVGIGRSFVDYSELTVKNVSINGFHVEYKNRNYFAAAAGTVDYLFRDHMFNRQHQRPQYITLLRYGKVTKSGSHLIFTAFRGRKNQFSYSDSANRFSELFGFSLESRVVFNRDNYLTAELAKSSNGFQRIGATSSSKFSFTDKSSTAFFVSFNGTIRKTQTKIRANYRYQGGNFQSFTLYYTQSNLTAWSVLADQSLWKKRLTIQAGLRKNEFTSIYLPVNYKSNVVFKSIQASLRIRKLPFVTVAYMPSSQLSVIDNKISENRFYTFLTSASHFYRVGKVYGTSLAMYSRFYNNPADTGFVYYNARNIHAAQSFMFKNFTSNSSFSLSTGEYDDLYTYEQGMNYNNRILSVGIGVKYNDLNQEIRKTGFYTNAGFAFERFNVDVNASFEHGFLPGLNHTLITNDFGRITILKRF